MLTTDLFGGFGKKPTDENIETGITKVSNDIKNLEVAEDDLGVEPKRARRAGARHERGHEPVPLYKYLQDEVEENIDPDNPWGDEGRFAGDVKTDISTSVTKAPIKVGQLVKVNDGRLRGTGEITKLKGDEAEVWIDSYARSFVVPLSALSAADVRENKDEEQEADYNDEYQAMVKRVGKLAKEGPRKTVWDPEKRVYKTVPVNPPKEKGVAEGSRDTLWRVERTGSGHGVRYYVVKGYNKDTKAWNDERGIGDFATQDRAQQKADELNQKLSEEQVDENLRNWFKDKWVRFGPDGKIRGDCARGDDSEGKPKCLPQSKAHALGKKGRASAAAKKRREDPNPERSGKAINVATKTNEEQAKLSAETVRRIQNFLNDKFDANLDVDGILGPLTVKSIKKFMPAAMEKLAPNPERTTAVQGKDVKQVDEKWSAKYKRSINCSHPKGFSQRAHCAGKKKHNESVEMEMTCPDCGMCETHADMSKDNLDEACWKGYHKEGNKKMFGKTYPNCVKNEDVKEEKCPHCGGPMFSEMVMNEKQDACYYKVKSRYKVWPSAYASGALVQCRKKSAKNWGDKSESIEEGRSFNDDDWYEIDPKTMSIVNSYGPQSFRNAFGDSQIKLPNGNIVVKGLRAKYMDLDTKKSIGDGW